MKTLSELRNSGWFVFLAALLTLLGPACARSQTRIRLATLLPRGSSQYHTLEEMGNDGAPSPMAPSA